MIRTVYNQPITSMTTPYGPIISNWANLQQLIALEDQPFAVPQIPEQAGPVSKDPTDIVYWQVIGFL